MDQEPSHLPGPIDYLVTLFIGGIDVWAQPPRLGNARISVDRATTDQSQEQVESPIRSVPAAERWPGIPSPSQDPTKQYRFLIRFSEKGDAGRPFSITINQRTGRIDWSSTDRYAFAKEHRGSGMIGVALLSLPLAIPLRAFDAYYRWKERDWGMSRHAKTILEGVRHELTPEELTELERAFRLEWEDDRINETTPTYDEARARLSSLRQQCTDDQDLCKEDIVPVRNCTWIDADGRAMAYGREVGPTGTCSVSIANMHFHGEEARRLLACYAERQHTDPMDR